MAKNDDGNEKIFPLSPVELRLIKTGTEIDMHQLREEITFQHTVLCQTSLPYRNPGPSVREWKREQGKISLLVKAGEAKDPETKEWVELGLPFGPKARLVLAHLNTEALQQGSNVVQVEESLTAFVRRIMGVRGDVSPNGREIKAFKNQLGALSASIIRMAVCKGNRAAQVNSQIVTAFDLWLSKDDNQRVLWPSEIHLSLDYYASLTKHAVPLNEHALAALSHSAMALDIYAWLAQRLHRINPLRPQFISWKALKDQFGQGYGRMDNFRRVFKTALWQVLAVYQAANVEGDGRGLTLRNSPPPVAPRMSLVPKK